MSVEKRLKELRIANDLSQKEMAEILGVSLSGYQNYEHGGRDIPTSVLARAMKKFGVDANWLFGEVPREQGGKGTGETATPTEQSLSAMDFETFITVGCGDASGHSASPSQHSTEPRQADRKGQTLPHGQHRHRGGKNGRHDQRTHEFCRKECLNNKYCGRKKRSNWERLRGFQGIWGFKFRGGVLHVGSQRQWVRKKGIRGGPCL